MKHLINSFLTLLLVIPGFSQNQTIDALVEDFKRNKQLSLAYIEAMPDDRFGFKPNDEIRSFAQQFLHASQGMIGLSANGTGVERIYPNDNLEKDETLQSKEEVKRIVTEAFDFAIEGIKNMDPNTYFDIVERGPFNVTRIGWVRKSLEHATHHRGQAAIYLRLSGITPPQFQLF